MAPTTRQSPTPRVVVYYQTQHTAEGQPISVLPLIPGRSPPSVTHLILAAIHLNDAPGDITLNDHSPAHPRYETLWAELALLRAAGVKVLAMLGGAARGSFSRLDLPTSPSRVDAFEAYYRPLRDVIRERKLDGLDLDVEEPMSLAGIIRLIDRLKADFGAAFVITLAPVAAALLSGRPEHNMSGFDYEALEVLRSESIAWYNAQFYNGWGSAASAVQYDAIVVRGFPPSRLVLGLLTSPENGNGWVSFELLWVVLNYLKRRYGRNFGGVMGWEYFNGRPGGEDRPWEWAEWMTRILDTGETASGGGKLQGLVEEKTVEEKSPCYVLDECENFSEEALPPSSFEYFTDSSIDA